MGRRTDGARPMEWPEAGNDGNDEPPGPRQSDDGDLPADDARVAGTAAPGAFDPCGRPGRRELMAAEFLAGSIMASSAKLSDDADQSGALLPVNDI